MGKLFIGQSNISAQSKVELAEIIGVMLGDGGIYINLRHGIHQTTVSGNSVTDYKYLIDYLKPFMQRVLGFEFKIKRHKKYKEILLINYNKKLVEVLNNLGIPSGNKTKNNVSIPKWIFESEEYIKACIRGLIDTDGSVCPITGRNYPYIWFKSSIKNLRKDFTVSMRRIGIKIAKWTGKETPQTYIGGKKEIEKYIKEVGFKNVKHINVLNKLNYFAPVV